MRSLWFALSPGDRGLMAVFGPLWSGVWCVMAQGGDELMLMHAKRCEAKRWLPQRTRRLM